MAAAAMGTLALTGCANPTQQLATPSQDRVDEACIQAAVASKDSYGHPEGLDGYVESLADEDKRNLLRAVKALGNAESEPDQYVSEDVVEAASAITDVTDPAQFSPETALALRSATIDCSYGNIKFTGNVDGLR